MIARVLYTTTIAAAAQGKNVQEFKTSLIFLFNMKYEHNIFRL